MKAKFTKVFAAALSVMMIFFTAVSVPTLNAKAFDNSVKSGVVAIVMYLKDAGIYITDGTNIEEVKHVGDTEWSGGSGFFIGDSTEGPTRIVTNNHVVESYLKANEGETFVYDTGQKYQNTYPIFVGAPSCEMRVYYSKNDYDIAYVECNGDTNKVDLAVLKIKNPTNKRHALKIQVPDESMVGETIYTIGFPANADNQFTGASQYGIEDATVHKGVINKFVTNEGKGVDRIAIDATIQHGNSGGPLVNEEGNVLGVNTNVESKSPYEGQVEADYYAISSTELVDFLNKNNIPYQTAGGSGMLILIIGIAAGVLVVGAGVAVLLIMMNKKKKKAQAPAPEGFAPDASVGYTPDGYAPTPSDSVGTGGGIPNFGDYGATAAPSSPIVKAVIRSHAAQHNGATYPVGRAPVMVGRNTAECVIIFQPGTPGVSSKHCNISFDSDSQEFTVTDLGSSFGTFLSNGEKLQPNVPVKLRPGDSIYIAEKDNTLTLELEQ